MIILFAGRSYGYTYSDYFLSSNIKPKTIGFSYYLVASYVPLTPEPREYLKGLVDPRLFGLLNRIVIAESNWHPEVHNKTSTASGLFQFLDSTFQHYCVDKYNFGTMADKDDPYIQIKCAVEMIKYEPNGLNHWLASRDNWLK